VLARTAINSRDRSNVISQTACCAHRLFDPRKSFRRMVRAV
jgi:hypothetical protein